MPRLFGVGQDLRARPALQLGQITGVIQMPVRQENGFDGLRREAQLADQPADQDGLPDQPSVNHHTRVTVGQQETAAHETADNM